MEYLRFLSSLLLCVLTVVTALLADQNSGWPSITQYPYLATVEYKGKSLCVATIVDDFFVAVPNSVFTDITDVKTLLVRVGTDKLGHRGSVHYVKTIHLFWNVSNSPTQDMALLEVASHFIFGPCCLWLNPNQDGLKEGQDGELVGWADFTTPGSPLLSIPVTVLPSSTCSQIYQGIYDITSGMYCVSPKDPSTPVDKVQRGQPLHYCEQYMGQVSHVENASLPIIVTAVSGCTTFMIGTFCDMGSLF